ncbi:hypothetical protein [Bradyrhizobium canariense]|uniref:Uncharacterized protein n=1 Tax=Bradyrhizobium canariense TaxID=255045 RepID=A0A1H1R9P6_9BRAD|nr:hypothetical protein [Bradyrhizobium canariense]SDS32441.1 hypothetical protein SAMN05444158_1704 [Bradyrhizobium canariense]
MKIGKTVILGSVAVLVILTSPALAKNTNTKTGDSPSASSSCHAYEPQANGSFTELPCQEVGAGSQTQHKSAAKSPDEDPRGRRAVR